MTNVPIADVLAELELLRQRVAELEAARERQQARFKGTPLACNADTRSAAHIREFCEVDEAGRSLMRAVVLSRAKREAGADDCGFGRGGEDPALTYPPATSTITARRGVTWYAR